MFTTAFWMGKFGGPTAKRHRLWSNDQRLLHSIPDAAGTMTKAEMQSLPGGPLVKKYKDKAGMNRQVGIRDKLKASQCLVCAISFSFYVL